MRFLPWHLNFLCRYVPLPEAEHAEAAREHPLLQSRVQAGPPAGPLERLLGDARAETHERFAVELLAAQSLDDARERATALAVALPERRRIGRSCASRAAKSLAN